MQASGVIRDSRVYHRTAARRTMTAQAIWSGYSPAAAANACTTAIFGSKILRQAVPLFQVLGAVVGDPHLALRIFRDQNFQRQVDGRARSRQHQRRAALWIAEDQELGGRHFHAHLFSFAAVVDQREQRHAFGLENGLELVDRLVHGVMARNFDNPFFFLHRERLRGQENENREHQGGPPMSHRALPPRHTPTLELSGDRQWRTSKTSRMMKLRSGI